MIRFLAFTDLHYAQMFDARERLDKITYAIEHSRVDFAICLGDLCYPTESNKPIVDQLNQLSKPVYYVAGNHDLQRHSADCMADFTGQGSMQYSFCMDDTKFIILNSCYVQHGDDILSLANVKYNKRTDSYPIVPSFEVEWLENEMRDPSLQYVIFSHHSLANDFRERGIVNREYLRMLLESRKTILAMNGHDHGDDIKVINGIPYKTVNSCSYIWHGRDVKGFYPEYLYEQYPYLKDMILYQTALYCIVELDQNKIQITGMSTEYMNATPEDVGIANRRWNGISIEPQIASWRNQ